jgi:hypothetical protein
MFTVKKIMVFDRSKVKRGNFITIAFMNRGDEGEWEESDYTVNGIIHSVEDNSIVFIDVEGGTRRLNIDNIYKEGFDRYPQKPIKILGIRSMVIGTEVAAWQDTESGMN